MNPNQVDRQLWSQASIHGRPLSAPECVKTASKTDGVCFGLGVENSLKNSWYGARRLPLFRTKNDFTCIHRSE
ncbi:hypothetical protein EMIT0P171_30191 [Pseudomonas sp. IT-P171]